MRDDASLFFLWDSKAREVKGEGKSERKEKLCFDRVKKKNHSQSPCCQVFFLQKVWMYYRTVYSWFFFFKRDNFHEAITLLSGLRVEGLIILKRSNMCKLNNLSVHLHYIKMAAWIRQLREAWMKVFLDCSVKIMIICKTQNMYIDEITCYLPELLPS